MVPWKKIRLELGPTIDRPLGSVSRAYLLHLPLQRDGHINSDRVKRYPLYATVRRFRANEADRSGYVVPNQKRWNFMNTPGSRPGAEFGSFADCALAVGNTVDVHEAGHSGLPFTIDAIDDD